MGLRFGFGFGFRVRVRVRVRFRVRVKRHDGGVNTVVGWARGEARKGRRRR